MPGSSGRDLVKFEVDLLESYELAIYTRFERLWFGVDWARDVCNWGWMLSQGLVKG